MSKRDVSREMVQTEQVLDDYLNGKGGKLTGQRRAVLKAVMTTHEHFSVEELYLALKRERAGISLASLYRTMPILAEAGIVRPLRFGTGMRYEHSFGHEHHDHLLCLGCGRIIEISAAGLDEVQSKACRNNSFVAESRSLVVRGYCRKCRGKR